MKASFLRSLFLFGLILVFGLYITISTASAAQWAYEHKEGIVQLANNIATSMTVSEVRDAIEDTDNPKLEKQGEDTGVLVYSRGNTLYMFNKKNRELMYKVIFYKISYKNDVIDDLTERCGEPTERENDLFFIDGDKGFKVIPHNEDIFSLWVGSVKLWEEFAEDHDEYLKFPEDAY